MTEPAAAPVKKEFIWGTGRRKKAIARVRLNRGAGEIQVNRLPFDKYFVTVDDREIAMQPLVLSKAEGRYDIFVTATGGGKSGQAGAMKLGVARALMTAEPALEHLLREYNQLTRDPRMKERKKYGLRGARRGVQYSKR
jgi:small subunit ribosomal protein S9